MANLSKENQTLSSDFRRSFTHRIITVDKPAELQSVAVEPATAWEQHPEDTAAVPCSALPYPPPLHHLGETER
jgi:hypothetical protein